MSNKFQKNLFRLRNLFRDHYPRSPWSLDKSKFLPSKLYSSLEKNLRREQIIRQVVAKIHASSGVENILQSTVNELSKALNTHGGAVQLSQNNDRNEPRKKQIYGFNRKR